MLLLAKTFTVPFLILVSFYSHLPAYEDGTECSETSAYKIQTPGNYPKESIQHTEHGESLKFRIFENLNFLEPSGPLQACNGTALPYTYIYIYN